MTSPQDNLVKMANQIGQFFQSQSESDPEAAARAVAAHLKNFWAPAMRESLLAHAPQIEPGALMPVVDRALREHGETLRTARAPSRDARQETWPPGGGDAG